MYKCSNKPSC